MSGIINKKTLEYLAELARIEIKNEKEEKLLSDLEKILEHFEELNEIDVSGVEPIAGATELTNVFRQDTDLRGLNADQCRQEAKKLIDAFPEKENEFLKVPNVF